MIVQKYGMEVDLSKLSKTACPKCRSKGRDKHGDNLHTYGLDENKLHLGARCFSCDFEIYSEQHVLNSKNNEPEVYDIVGKEFNAEVFNEIKVKTGFDGKGFRNLDLETTRFFQVRYEYDEDGEPTTVYYPVTKAGKMSGFKVRGLPKDFANPGPYGETGKMCDLFNQFRFESFAGTVMIVGGEEDALAAYQMLADGQKNKQYDAVAVVSPTIGESGAYAQVREQYKFFDRFKKIIIAMDNDEAGHAAAAKIADVLPRGKIFNMVMRRKDPSDYLQNGKQSEFINDFWNAKPFVPEGVKSAEQGMSEIRDELMKPRITLPDYMYKMQDKMGGGIIQGRIANIIAATSVGKSAHVNRMGYHWIFNSPVKPTFISLEATAGQLSLEMLSIHLKNNMLWTMGEKKILEYLETDECKVAMREIMYDENGNHRYFVVDERDGGIEEVQAQAEMMWKKYDSKLFVIDVLSDLLRGSSSDKAEDHLKWQRQMAKNGVTIVNVLHTRKPDESTAYPIMTEYDALGTGSFVQSAAINIVLNRDKNNSDTITRNTTEASMPKCRNGITGDAGKWYYDFATSTCYDLDDWKMNRPNQANF